MAICQKLGLCLVTPTPYHVPNTRRLTQPVHSHHAMWLNSDYYKAQLYRLKLYTLETRLTNDNVIMDTAETSAVAVGRGLINLSDQSTADQSTFPEENRVSKGQN